MTGFLSKKLMAKYRGTYPLMRQPDRLPRCYEMTEDERLAKMRQLNNRNVWNTPELARMDRLSNEQ